MNKLLLLLILFSNYSFAQIVRFDGICISSEENLSESKSDLIFKNNDLQITLTPSTFWKINIKNLSNNTVSVNWNESYFIIAKTSSGIIFNNDNFYTAKDLKPNENIAPNTNILKEIFPKETYLNNGVSVITGVVYKQGAPFVINLTYNIEDTKKSINMKMDAIVCKKQK